MNYAQIKDHESVIYRRHDAAVREFYRAMERTGDWDTACEAEMSALMEGFEFSKYDLIESVLWDDFGYEPVNGDRDPLCCRLIPECEPIFSRYALENDYEQNPDNQSLRKEIAGYIREKKLFEL